MFAMIRVNDLCGGGLRLQEFHALSRPLLDVDHASDIKPGGSEMHGLNGIEIEGCSCRRFTTF